MFFSASFPSLLDPDNIPFQLCLFFYGGKGCCRTLIHTLNTTSIISLRASRCTLIRASFLFLMLFNSLPLMLFVGNFVFCFVFFSKEGFKLPSAFFLLCVSLGVSHSHFCPNAVARLLTAAQRLKSRTCLCLNAAFYLVLKVLDRRSPPSPVEGVCRVYWLINVYFCVKVKHVLCSFA